MEGIRIPVKIHLSNRQRKLRLDPAAVSRLIRALAHRAFPAETGNPFVELTVLLTDNEAMPGYKAGCFGERRQTDVVSQAYAALPGTEGASAELIINAERALSEGEARPGGPARELALYLAHGLDHLAGYDDDTPEHRREMRCREILWLDAEQAAVEEILRG